MSRLAAVVGSNSAISSLPRMSFSLAVGMVGRIATAARTAAAATPMKTADFVDWFIVDFLVRFVCVTANLCSEWETGTVSVLSHRRRFRETPSRSWTRRADEHHAPTNKGRIGGSKTASHFALFCTLRTSAFSLVSI